MLTFVAMVVALAGEILYAADSLYAEGVDLDVYYVTPALYAVSYAFSMLMLWLAMK